MSNGGRPSVQRKVTRKSKESTKAALDEGISVSFDGKTYSVTMGDLTGPDVMALRQELGLSFVGLLRAMQTDPDIDLIAGIVWLSRRINGERGLPLQAVAAEIGYEALINLKVDEPEVPEPGEASGGTS